MNKKVLWRVVWGVLGILGIYWWQSGYRLLAVIGGSMGKAYPAGSVILIKPAKEIKEGDVITFKLQGKKETLVTHRVAEIIDGDNGALIYVTKGDAVSECDSARISEEQIAGKVVWGFP